MRTIAAALVGLIALVSASGCGFTPIYAERQGTTAALRAMTVNTPETRSGYLVRQAVLDRIDARGSDDVRYVLDLTVSERRQREGVRIDNVATRFNLSMRATYTLTPVDGNRPLTRGRVSGEVTFDLPGGAFEDVAVEESARVRAAELLAERLTLELALYFDGIARSSP